MELVAMVLIVGVTGGLLVWPLLRRGEAAVDRGTAAPDRNREKEMALLAIRELEFDYATGKISAEDYGPLRARYEARALEIMTQPAPAAPGADAPRDLDAEIEAAIAQARGGTRCLACGDALPRDARFCPACGAPAAVEVRR